MTDPRVSVVMSIYNDARFVVEAVQSVLAQTMFDLELIIVDDGSTDEGPALVRQFRDERIRVISQENQGLAAAINVGVRTARAPWIARHDADDVSDPDRLRLQLEHAARSQSLVLIGTNALQTDEAGCPIVETTFPDDDRELRAMLMRQNNPFIHGSVIFSREAAMRVGLYRPAFRQSQDYDLWLRLMDCGTLGMVEQPLYRWRMRSGAVGTGRAEGQRDHARLALLCAERRAAQLPEPPLDVAVVRRGPVLRSLQRLREAPGDAAYDLGLAKLLLRGGHRKRARAHALTVVRRYPLNAYGWLLGALTLLPSGPANSLWRIGVGIYRRMIWKR